MPDDVADTPEILGQTLRTTLEGGAGASFVGPDARTLTYTFDRDASFVVPYLTVAFDGFQEARNASQEMLQFAVSHTFHISGNAVTLGRSPIPDPAGQFPSGSILMWRGEGGTPRFGVDGDGYWSVIMTYLLLPPFAHVTG